MKARSGVTIDLVVIQLSYQTVEVTNLSGGKPRTMSYLGVGVGVGIGFTMVKRSDPVPYSTAQPATTADFGGFAGRGATPGATVWESSVGGDMHSNLGPPGNKPAKMPQNSAGLDLVLFNAGLGYWR